MLKIYRGSRAKGLPQKRCSKCNAPFGRRNRYCRVCGARRRSEGTYDPSEDGRRVDSLYDQPTDQRSIEPDGPDDTIRLRSFEPAYRPGDTIRLTAADLANRTCETTRQTVTDWPGDTIRMPNAEAAYQPGDTIRIAVPDSFPPTERD